MKCAGALALALMVMCAAGARAACLGDCDGDGEVTITEIVRGVNIALGQADMSDCAALDANADAAVTVEELVTAVNNALLGCVVPTPTPAPAKLHSISVDALAAALPSKDFLLINVHVPNAGEIPGTDVHIPYTDIDALVDYIGPSLDRSVVLYCYSNYMSGIAGNALVARGYTAIAYLDGGMGAWRAAGHPVSP